MRLTAQNANDSFTLGDDFFHWTSDEQLDKLEKKIKIKIAQFANKHTFLQSYKT